MTVKSTTGVGLWCSDGVSRRLAVIWRVIWEKENVLFLQVWHQILREPAVKQPRRNDNNIHHGHFTHSDVRPIFIIVSVSLLIGDIVLYLNNYRMILKVLSVILFSCKHEIVKRFCHNLKCVDSLIKSICMCWMITRHLFRYRSEYISIHTNTKSYCFKYMCLFGMSLHCRSLKTVHGGCVSSDSIRHSSLITRTVKARYCSPNDGICPEQLSSLVFSSALVRPPTLTSSDLLWAQTSPRMMIPVVQLPGQVNCLGCIQSLLSRVWSTL